MIYPKHTPQIIKPLAKHLCFELPNNRDEIYLTFDDGPHPEITPWVLDTLKAFDAKATFFLIGKQALAYPDVVEKILAEGHAIGNHTQSHVSGWKSTNADYLNEIAECSSIVDSNLFRPPYGQLTYSQSMKIKSDYTIIMWSDLSADFDERYTSNQCVSYATKKVKPGSIIVFHDSDRAWPRLEQALPACLSFYQDNGYKMRAISL